MDNIFDKLEKDKCYCNLCLKENIVTEIPFDNNFKNYVRPNCKHKSIKGGNFYILCYKENDREWLTIRGLNPLNEPEIQKVKLRTCEGLCSICKKYASKRDNCSRGYDCGCHEIWYREHNNSDLMKEIVSKKMKLWHNTDAGKLFLYNLNNYYEDFCETCNKNTIHNGFKVCGVCNPGIMAIGQKIFKDDNKCLTHKKEKLQYFDKKSLNYICWSCFKEKFYYSKCNNFEDQILVSSPNVFIQPTFRSQDSNNWNGFSAAFEQNLVEKEVYWFVYIKSYIRKDNNIVPLVVGKSGSLLVNCCGSDICFSTNEDDGPSRRFLKEYGLMWDKTQVFIIPFITEKEAYNKEIEIFNLFNLFYS